MRLVVLLLFVLPVLEFEVSTTQIGVDVPICDRRCSQPTLLSLFCGTASRTPKKKIPKKKIPKKKIPTTTIPTKKIPTTRTPKPKVTNEKIIHDLRAKISRLEAEKKSCKSEGKQFREELNVCKSDHEKYVESMARTKAIIEGIIAGKNGY